MREIWTKIRSFFYKYEPPRWVLIILFIVLILRIPSFFEPYYYGDEMVYLTLGQGIRQGMPLYSGLYDNKPPFIYILAAISGNLFWFKAILAFWALATIVVFWKLSEALFPKRQNLHKVATLVFALSTTIPLFEGNIVNAELFMIGPTMLAFLLLLTKNLSPKNLFISGFLFSISAFFKIPAVFDIPVIIFYWILTSNLQKEKLKEVFKNSLYLTTGFAAPIALTFIWYLARGAFKEYFVAAYLQNIGYLSSFRPGDIQKPFLIRNGPLFIRAAVVIVGAVILYLKRNKISKQFIFLALWLLFTLFAATLSERPYPHYLIQVIPTVSLFFAILFTDKTIEQSLTIIPLALFFFVSVYFKFYYYPSGPYYLRFINFSFGKINQEQYFNQFDGNTIRNYKIAKFLLMSSKKGEKVFVWGDSPVIYALTRKLPPVKYIAAYHVLDYSSTKKLASELSIKNPAFIILLPNAPAFPEIFQVFKNNRYILIETIDRAQIWKLVSGSTTQR